MRIRRRKSLTRDRDYLFFALQIDYPGKPNLQSQLALEYGFATFAPISVPRRYPASKR
jgi:hypothetical protein